MHRTVTRPLSNGHIALTMACSMSFALARRLTLPNRNTVESALLKYSYMAIGIININKNKFVLFIVCNPISRCRD